ncbi:hypothetical protein [Povalibacter sp.]|uniref:chorismate transformation enzyme, FkbO/Hyg5 family n=1 Tax=Povalibacter sp. TaxID=1962978 RepID=UPI002F3EF0D4
MSERHPCTAESLRDRAPDQHDQPSRIRIDYARTGDSVGPVLAVISFGTSELPGHARADPDTLHIHVALEPQHQIHERLELWHANGAITSGRDGLVRYTRDADRIMAILECDEREYGGIEATSELVYREMRRFQEHCGYPHLLRVWNYFDAINAGEGDLERYRQFCTGRTRGLGDASEDRFPAASAIGTQSSTQRLQVYWLAARHAGLRVENPRQVSAFRYPRDYGPTPPTFARAMKVGTDTLLISGTASIVGHASQHHGDALAQIDETIRNIEVLQAQAGLPAGGKASVKIYVRHELQLSEIEARIRRVWPDSQLLVLAADICRSELLLEIEGVVTV